MFSHVMAGCDEPVGARTFYGAYPRDPAGTKLCALTINAPEDASSA